MYTSGIKRIATRVCCIQVMSVLSYFTQVVSVVLLRCISTAFGKNMTFSYCLDSTRLQDPLPLYVQG